MAYPRPQFVRREWHSLDGLWLYSFSQVTDPEAVAWQGNICVPFPPESVLSGVQDTGFHPVIWYRRQFLLPEEWQGRRVLLHFGAVDYQAQVWLNGHLVACHEGGHTPFSVDISAALSVGHQEITVRAADDPLDMDKPRGKQDWELEPHAIWYPRTSGIWQTVWIEPLSDASISSLRFTPDIDSLCLDTEVEIEASAQELSLEMQLSFQGELLDQQVWVVTGSRLTKNIHLPRPGSNAARLAMLWSPENPVLYDLVFTLRQGEDVLDRVESYAGLRQVQACGDEIHLNGQPYFLKMALDQGYWADSLLAAPNPEALRRDVELAKQLGFNGVRKHQKIEDPRYLYWADHLGLLVWGELPSAYRFSERTAQRLAREFAAMIDRDFNHPCIMAWVPFNESWGIPDLPRAERQRHLAQALYHLAKSLDPTRLVIENDGWEHCCTDLYTVHDYENKPELFTHRYGSPEGLAEGIGKGTVGHLWSLEGFSHQGLPVVLSEFGGIRLTQAGKGWGYVQVQTTEDFLALFEPLMKSAAGRVLAGYCYTQLTDTFQEQNGLLYMDRTPKVDPAVIAEILSSRREARSPSELAIE